MTMTKVRMICLWGGRDERGRTRWTRVIEMNRLDTRMMNREKVEGHQRNMSQETVVESVVDV